VLILGIYLFSGVPGVSAKRQREVQVDIAFDENSELRLWEDEVGYESRSAAMVTTP